MKFHVFMIGLFLFLFSVINPVEAQSEVVPIPQIGISVGIENEVAIIQDVLLDSPFNAELQEGDIILTVNNLPATPETIRAIPSSLAKATHTFNLDLFVSRAGRGIPVSIEFSGGNVVSTNSIQVVDFAYYFTTEKLVFNYDLMGSNDGSQNPNVQLRLLNSEDNACIPNAGDNKDLSDETGCIRLTQNAASIPSTVSMELPLTALSSTQAYTFYPEIMISSDENLTTILGIDTTIPNSVGLIIPETPINVAGVHMVIQRIYPVDRPVSIGHKWMVLEFVLYNDTPSDIDFFDTDFAILSGAENREFIPNTDNTGAIRDLYYPNQVAYPGTRYVLDGHPRLTVKAKHQVNTILAYEIPEDADNFLLRFARNGNTRNVRVWFSPSSASTDYRFMLAEESADGNIDMEIMDFQIDTITVGETLDGEIIDIDNCGGVGERRSTRGIEVSEITSQNVQVNFFANINVPIPIINLQGQLTSSYSRDHRSELTQISTEEFVAPPDSHVKYQIIWSRADISGTAVLRVGAEIVEIPFTLTDRIRPTTVLIPTDPCS